MKVLFHKTVFYQLRKGNPTSVNISVRALFDTSVMSNRWILF